MWKLSEPKFSGSDRAAVRRLTYGIYQMSAKAVESPEAKEKTPAADAAAPHQQPEVKRFAPVEMERGDSAPVLYRNTTVAPDDFSDDNTFQIAISSEFPGLQRASAAHEKLGIAKAGELFTEVLSHEPDDVDLSWLNSGRAALLDEHKSNRHLGKIHKANLAHDKVVRGVVEFDGETKLSKTRRNQMRKKSRVNISCGYVQTRYLGPTKLSDGTTGHRFAFQPREASSVADPMDPTVGLSRAAEQCACYGCGKNMNRSDMKTGSDGGFYCGQDCIDAEDSDESLRSNTTRNADFETLFRTKREAIKERKSRKADDFKFKRDMEDEISFSELATAVGMAVDSDKRFKSKRPNGDLVSAFFVDDIYLDQDTGDWAAIIFNWYDGTFFCVEFELQDDDTVMLGDAVQGNYEQNFVPLDGSGRSTVDSRKLSTAGARRTGKHSAQNNLPKTIMAKSVAELKTEAPDLVAQLETETRTATEKTTRAAITVEFEAARKADAVKIEQRNKELIEREEAAIKTYGARVNGKPGEVFYCGERIRKVAAELRAKDLSHDGVELRREFGMKLDEITQGSREAKNPMNMANVPEELARHCSLGNLLRTAMEKSKDWSGSGPYRVTEGAEAEADLEIRKNAREFPGGEANLHPGIQLPLNTPTAIRSKTPMNKYQRDSLAGDFGTAGAFVAPDYRFPFIELLRNIPVLGRAGMTMLTGLQGGGLVLPRQW